MRSLLEDHFNVQTGMYFDRNVIYEDWIMFISDTIEDNFWNYAVIPTNCDLKRELSTVENILKEFKRPLSLYEINDNKHSDRVGYLLDCGYKKVAKETFMIYKRTPSNRTACNTATVMRVLEKAEIQDFVSVFTSAYGGEITPEQPYGELDKTYVEALGKSFKNTDKFYHYVCYFNNKPVAVASLCYENGKGGIYNVGTDPYHRGCGYGTLATMACVEKWAELGGDTLFLQTETGSKVESWYYFLGFEPIFYGSTYCKEG